MDGVYPEKVNAGREKVNCNMRRIGDNVDQDQVHRQEHLRPVRKATGARVSWEALRREEPDARGRGGF
jgi:hypothetical protein